MPTITLSSNTSWYLYNFRASTIRRLISEGYSVTCLSPEDDYSHKLESELGCQWLPLKMNNQGTNPITDASLVYQFWRYYRQLSPVAAMHFTIKNNVYGTWAARNLGIPAINNVSGLGTGFIHKGPVAAVVRGLYKTSMPYAHHIFCQNAEDRELLISNGLIPADRVELIPGSGVDLQRFSPGTRVAQERPLRFLFAGRMLADKGLRELIEAATAINANSVKAELWLLGFADVENISAINQQELASWGDIAGVSWLGPRDDMENVYAQVDCVVLPSYREGLPRTLLEAGAMGLPVVTTNVPGCRSVVADGVNGLLCEARSPTSLEQAMRRVLGMSAGERDAMGREGRALVERQYSEELVIEAALNAVASARAGL
jgi:glycosyltransferase involved in cell wall biosynthesis